MKVVPLGEQPEGSRYLDLSGPDIDERAYSGQDSTVYRDTRTDRAIHVYHFLPLDGVAKYARCMNAAALSLHAFPFTETIRFGSENYTSEAHANPVEEAGKKLFSFMGEERKHAYTISPFIDALSLCWPNQTDDEHQRTVAKCFDMLFYDRVNDWIERQSSVRGVDINPVNVKFVVDRERQRIQLMITDLAKNIGDVRLI